MLFILVSIKENWLKNLNIFYCVRLALVGRRQLRSHAFAANFIAALECDRMQAVAWQPTPNAPGSKTKRLWRRIYLCDQWSGKRLRIRGFFKSRRVGLAKSGIISVSKWMRCFGCRQARVPLPPCACRLHLLRSCLSFIFHCLATYTICFKKLHYLF